jgi:hypothetical protein
MLPLPTAICTRRLTFIAAHAPDLVDVLAHARAAGLPFLCLDGTLVCTDRVAPRAERGHHLWFSGNISPSAAALSYSPTRPAFRCGSPLFGLAPPTT